MNEAGREKEWGEKALAFYKGIQCMHKGGYPTCGDSEITSWWLMMMCPACHQVTEGELRDEVFKKK